MSVTLKLFLLFLVLNLASVHTKSFNLRSQAHDMQQFQQLHLYSSSSGNSLGGAVIGFILSPVLFILSFIIIWNNQRKAAIDHRRMKLAESLVNEVNPFNQNNVHSSQGKLVHITGDSQCNETVVDPESGIALNGIIKISRQVQVREFRQHGTDKNRRYEVAWVSSNDPSPGGGYSNDPGCWFIKQKTTNAQRVNVGNYFLNQNQIQRLTCQQVYNPTQQDGYNIASRSYGRVKNQPIINGQYIYFPTIAGSLDAPGTLRVRYRYCTPGQTSIIAQSQKNTFVPFRIDIQENGVADVENHQSSLCCCLLSDCIAGLLSPIKQIDLITQRKISYHEMIQEEINTIACKRNLIRFFSYLLMVGSICAFFSPITTLIGYVPFLGGFLSSAVGLAIFLAAAIVCLPLFLLALSISWLVFHPKVGLILLGIALVITGIVLAVIFKNKGNDNSNDAQKTAEAVKHLAYSLKSIF